MSPVMQLVRPVWLNTYWVANALGLCEGLWPHADELNVDHGHFFALVTKYSIDAAVLGLCKLYDRSNPQYKKDTIPSLNEHLKINFTPQYSQRLDAGILIDLGASEDTAAEIVTRLRGNGDFADTKTKIFELIDQQMPRRKNGSPLRRLFTHRDKNIAHQEQLIEAPEYVKEAPKSLPSFEDMLSLNKWASDFCRLVVTLLSNESLLTSPVSAQIAALNVVEKVLGKKFDPSKRF
jgi:hypothetical protein